MRDTILPGLAAKSRRGSSRAGNDVAVPPSALVRVFDILQRGSIGTLAPSAARAHPAVESAAANAAGGVVREQFARACFEALVDASAEAGGDDGGEGAGGLLVPMGSLLTQCTSALEAYIRENAAQPPAGATPGRDNAAATVLVLRAVGALVSPKLPRAALALYPLLVALIGCGTPEMRPLVQAALARYTPLLTAAASGHHGTAIGEGTGSAPASGV